VGSRGCDGRNRTDLADRGADELQGRRGGLVEPVLDRREPLFDCGDRRCGRTRRKERAQGPGCRDRGGLLRVCRGNDGGYRFTDRDKPPHAAESHLKL
jgi:hypothetical protein